MELHELGQETHHPKLRARIQAALNEHIQSEVTTATN
jgi:hypothetical protein